ncbi:hypothetical protein BCPG3_113 [Bacillus phage BCPG3]|uniref:Uncharacterized protein n=3 Tax=root TaxID=1 RepID=W5QUV0_9CAUD|nr:hypothetical protein BPS13_0121 [Bacillus phage BPS13]YP_009003006.1 hypothetical protein BPS10C_120 [Bacillus phage BPS10C]OTZ47896.1 hypothetical protein BK762_19625 [Bacillus thuringiensis serovar toumanoffi]QQO38881.1 hypothetical protein BCPG1_150 [Bacillus phage BCPG1]QSJ04430.1 hypothetical protein BCPG3_113 [Bacillus phage BCPG3]QSJ04640.1 hypothetical protein BCP18_108 [Bacillus phage BCP18]AEZ50300.1 hypothetical protein BPS13_0121 [Bacillus phage BPS13]
MSELKYFTCTMTAEITRVVEARDKEHALEIVDENDMMYELKNFKTDYEMSAKEMGVSRFNISYQHKMLIVHNIFAYLVDGKPIKVTTEQYELFKAVYDVMETGVRLDVKYLNNDKVILSLGRVK